MRLTTSFTLPEAIPPNRLIFDHIPPLDFRADDGRVLSSSLDDFSGNLGNGNLSGIVIHKQLLIRNRHGERVRRSPGGKWTDASA